VARTERRIVSAHRGDRKHLVVHADEKLTALQELDSAVRPNATDHFRQQILPKEEISDEPASNIAGRYFVSLR
jgi:hypothetical protein